MKVLARIWVREGDDSALSDFPINSLVELAGHRHSSLGSLHDCQNGS